MRFSVFRVALLTLLLAILIAPIFGAAQESSSTAGAPRHEPAQAGPQAPSVPDQLAAAEAAIATSDWKTAEAKLDPWLVTHPSDPRALFDSGYIADAQNHFDDAAALYGRAITADPKSFESHLSLGLLLAREGKSEEARPEFVTATTLDPGEAGPALKARAWRALASIDRDTNPTEASTDLLEALKLTPETSADSLLAADLAEKSGQLDDAAAAYHRILAGDPKSLPANIGLAHILIARKQYPDAETLLRAALVQFPGDPTLTAELASALVAQDKAEALPLLQQLHAAHPETPAITRMLASVLADAGDYAGSDQLDAGLLATNPSDVVLLVAHGQNLVHQANFAQAYAVFDKATQIDASSAEGWGGLAFTASRTGHYDVTLHALAMRSKLQPETASTLFLWATAYDSLHQKQQAAAYYHRFLDADAGKFPNQEWQARQRLQILGK
jgi:tetratricopeptide (TPR) repeat protein